MIKSIIFHGHFYQPPRENPWTGEIPNQPSAFPFDNWNERIFSECYRANSASRFLNSDGKIIKINNNYEQLSFNFGPTLLSWIKDVHFDVYNSIIDADKKSKEIFNGHGNAIAQVYNHIIMPLADEKDKRTQIEWGISDFKNHFNRDPEGIWLAETAINHETIDLLIEYNLKFVILSPWQCNSIKNSKNNKWEQVKNPIEVSQKAYKIKGGKGELAVFFYDHILAQGISFEHYLQDADHLHETLLHKSATSDQPLIHCATDGEIYGHHEPFGDMCYSALIEKMQSDSTLKLNNYGNFLAENPPTQEVKIKLGEKNRGSSWSCFHGVSRWYKDCGCSTGGQDGWNQKWRGHLRNSFDFLNHKIRTIYAKEMARFTTTDPEIIWNQYIDVLTEKISNRDFFLIYSSKNNISKLTDFFTLLESRKYLTYSYTSCGWFFAELSGIEPVQNICYALRSIELISKYSEEPILKEVYSLLKKAKSNLNNNENGEELAKKAEKQYKQNEFNIAATFISKAIGKQNPNEAEMNDFNSNQFGNYKIKHISFLDSSRMCCGKIEFSQFRLCIDYNFKFELKLDSNNELIFEFKYNGKKLLLLARDAGISASIKHSMIVKLLNNWNNSDEQFNKLIILLEEISLNENGLAQENRDFYLSLINMRLEKIILELIESNIKKNKISKLSPLLKALTNEEYKISKNVELSFSKLLHSKVLILKNNQSKAITFDIIEICKIIYTFQIRSDRTNSQGVVYKLATTKNKIKNNKNIIMICNYLNIETEELFE